MEDSSENRGWSDWAARAQERLQQTRFTEGDQRNYLALALVLAAIIFFGVLYLDNYHNDQYYLQERQKFAAVMDRKAADLELRLSQILDRLIALKGYVQSSSAQITPQQFQLYASNLDLPRSVQFVELAPGGIVSAVHPIEGRESMLKLDLASIVGEQKVLETIVKEKKFRLLGPQMLPDQKEGLVGRLPVYVKVPRVDQEEFWGFISVAIDTGLLLTDWGLEEYAKDTEFELRGRDGLGSKGATIASSFEKIELHNPARSTVRFANGQWELYTFPKGGWVKVRPGSTKFKLLGFFIAGLTAAYFLYLSQSQRATETGDGEEGHDDRFQSLFEQAPIGLVELDRQGRIVLLNHSARRLVGARDQDDLEGRYLADRFTDHDQSSINQTIESARSGRASSVSAKIRSEREFDVGRTLSTRSAPLTNGDGHIEGVLAVLDETSVVSRPEPIRPEPVRMEPVRSEPIVRTEIDPRLQEIARRYSFLTDNAPDMIRILTHDGRLDYISPACRRLLGYAPEDLTGRSLTELCHAEDISIVEDAWRHAGNGRVAGPVKYRQRHKNGKYIWVESVISPLVDAGNGPGRQAVEICRDLADAKKKEQTLIDDRQRLQRIFKDSPSPLLEIDFGDAMSQASLLGESAGKDLSDYLRDNPGDIDEFARLAKIVNVNPATSEFLGVPEGELIDGPLPVADDDYHEFWRKHLLKLADERLPETMTATLVGDRGRRKEVAIHYGPLDKKTGRVVATLASVLEAPPPPVPVKSAPVVDRLAQFFRRSADLHLVTDTDGRLERSSASFLDLVGQSVDSLAGKSVFELLHSEERETARKQFDRCSEDRPIRDLEVRVKRKDNKLRWLNWTLHHDNDDNRIYWTGRDISELRSTFEELAESEALYRESFAAGSLPQAVFTTDRQLIDANAAFEKLTGLSHDELIERTWETLTPTEERAKEEPRLQKLFGGQQEKLSIEKRFVGKGDRALPPASLELRTLKDEDGEPLALVATVNDSADRQKLQQELAAANTKLNFWQAFRNALPDSMMLFDSAGQCVDAIIRDPNLVSSTNMQQLIGKSARQTLVSHLADPLEPLLTAALADRQPREQILGAEGRRHQVRLAPVGDSHVLAILRDQTDLLADIERAKQQGEHFLRVFEHAPIAMQLFEDDGDLVAVNEANRQLFGSAVGAVDEKYNLLRDALLSPEEKRALSEGRSVRLDRWLDLDPARSIQMHKPGQRKRIHVEYEISPVFAETPTATPTANVGANAARRRIAGLLAILTDDTEEELGRLAEEQTRQLAQSILQVESESIGRGEPGKGLERMLETVRRATASPVGFIAEVAEKTGRLQVRATDSHDTLRKYFHSVGSTRGGDVGVGQTVEPAAGPVADVLRTRQPVITTGQGGEPVCVLPVMSQNELIGVVGLGQRPEGYDERWGRWLSPLADGAGALILAERVHAEHRRQLAESQQRLVQLEEENSQLEKYAYNLARELKEPVATIRGHSEYLESEARARDYDQLQEDLAKIRHSADRLQKTLDELLQMSRVGRQSRTTESVSLTEVARLAMQQQADAIRRSRAQIHVQPDLPTVRGDRGRILEVFNVLIGNALQYSDADEPRIEIGSRHDGHETVVTVQDNGVGIDPRNQGKIFNMFTKIDAANTAPGLGLAVAKRIVDGYDGRIWVESDGRGRGSTFCFTLPDPDEPGQRRP